MESFVNEHGFFVNDKVGYKKNDACFLDVGSGNFFYAWPSLQIMWADIQAAHIVSYFEVLKLDVDLEKYPKIATLKKTVEAHPKIAAWTHERPVTEF